MADRLKNLRDAITQDAKETSAFLAFMGNVKARIISLHGQELWDNAVADTLREEHPSQWCSFVPGACPMCVDTEDKG